MHSLISLADLVAAGSVDLDVLVPLSAQGNNVTLFRCGQCLVPRPAFALYDTRAADGFEADWTCESDVAAVLRAAQAAIDAVPTLAAVRVAKRLAINERRDQVESCGCMTPIGKRVDTDDKARGRISGAVQMALLAKLGGTPYSVDWTMEDNSVVVLDADGMIALGVAVATHVAQAFETAKTLKAAVDSAGTFADVEAVEWPE